MCIGPLRPLIYERRSYSDDGELVTASVPDTMVQQRNGVAFAEGPVIESEDGVA